MSGFPRACLCVLSAVGISCAAESTRCDRGSCIATDEHVEKHEYHEVEAVQRELLQLHLQHSRKLFSRGGAEVRISPQTDELPLSVSGVQASRFLVSRWEPSQKIKTFELSLQDGYSRKLYGALGRVPPDNDLRIIWLDLLEPWELEELAQISVCDNSSNPFGSPYFAPLSVSANPFNSLWKHNEIRPGKPYEWIEVTHCGKSCSDCMSGFIWYYGAPGSGISINLRNSVFLGYHEDSLEEVAEDMALHLHHYDSVQIIHLEPWSLEWRHEVIFRGAENEVLDFSTAGIKCGRHPYLFDCLPDHPPFEYMSHCSPDFSTQVSAKLPRQRCEFQN